jgi:hypothetical protein
VGFRNVLDPAVRAQPIAVPNQRLHPDDVDAASEVFGGAERDHDGEGPRAQAAGDHRAGPRKVGADTIHLVDERDARHPVLVGLAPDGLGLRLDPAHGAKDGDRAVEDTERALDFGGEIDVSGGVDDVDAVVVPEAGGGRGGDRDPPLLLLDHPVHGGRAVVDLAQLVGDARVEEDALGGRGLTGIDVGHDADVPSPLQ